MPMTFDISALTMTFVVDFNGSLSHHYSDVTPQELQLPQDGHNRSEYHGGPKIYVRGIPISWKEVVSQRDQLTGSFQALEHKR